MDNLPVDLADQAPSSRSPETVFRAFSPHAFLTTPSWRRLDAILRGNGGCYGLYGPRGAGKSWLMMMAIQEANHRGGLGLWFPSPSEYDPANLISALSDNLASAVEPRFSRSRRLTQILHRVRIAIGLLLFTGTVAPAVIQLLLPSDSLYQPSWYNTIPLPLLAIATLLVVALLLTYVLEYTAEDRPYRRLGREAASLRERIRFAVDLKHGSELGITAGQSLVGSLKRLQERSLAERPVTATSLVVDFRNFAALVARTLPGPVVIGIDELDKMENPEAVRTLLRDIKGIFEVTDVHFLVSVSEEAAAALHLGTLQTGGRNEFNSSLYTVIELPPLNPTDVTRLLESRGTRPGAEIAAILCLLSAGNQRELIRIADVVWTKFSDFTSVTPEDAAILLLREECQALLREIIKASAGEALLPLTDAAKSNAWRALSVEHFRSVDSFMALGVAGIQHYWTPDWDDNTWEPVRESWRRLLIRLFVASKVLEDYREPGEAPSQRLLCDEKVVVDLRDVLIMATHDSGVGQLMLESRFGAALDGRYQTSTALRLPTTI